MTPTISTANTASQFINLPLNEDTVAASNTAASVAIDSAFGNKAQKVDKQHADAIHAANTSSNPELRAPAAPAGSGSPQELLAAASEEFSANELAQLLLSDDFLAALSNGEESVLLNKITDEAKRAVAKELMATIKSELTQLASDLKAGMPTDLLKDSVIAVAKQLISVIYILSEEKSLSQMEQDLLAMYEENLEQLIKANDKKNGSTQYQIIALLCKLMEMLLILNTTEQKLSTMMTKIAYESAKIQSESMIAEGFKGMGGAIAGATFAIAGAIGTLTYQSVGFHKERLLETDKRAYNRDKALLPEDLKVLKEDIKQIETQIVDKQKEHAKQTEERTEKWKNAFDEIGENDYQAELDLDKKSKKDLAELKKSQDDEISGLKEQIKIKEMVITDLPNAKIAAKNSLTLQRQQIEAIKATVQMLMSQMAIATLINGITQVATKHENATQAMAAQDTNVHDKNADAAKQNSASALSLVERVKELLQQFFNSKNETVAFITNHIKG